MIMLNVKYSWKKTKKQWSPQWEQPQVEHRLHHPSQMYSLQRPRQCSLLCVRSSSPLSPPASGEKHSPVSSTLSLLSWALLLFPLCPCCQIRPETRRRTCSWSLMCNQAEEAGRYQSVHTLLYYTCSLYVPRCLPRGLMGRERDLSRQDVTS